MTGVRRSPGALKRLSGKARRTEQQIEHLREHLAHHRQSAVGVSVKLFGRRLAVEDLSGQQRFAMEEYLQTCQREKDRSSLEHFARLSDEAQQQAFEDLLR